MAKTASHTGGPKWTAEHRYGDVFECSNGKISLSHSKRGLEAAKANLEANGSDSAMAQLKQVDAKLKAINEDQAGAPVEAAAGEE
jgi:predicted negative regulator of RcsB-dependent stress response